MSWMDSWSRPSKSQATPPPFYLLPGGEKTAYCKSCGRVIGDRKTKSATASATPAKYCSSRCRTSRPNKALDRKIETTFVALLNGVPLSDSSEPANDAFRVPARGMPTAGKKKKKGENRILVECSEVESLVFGDRNDPEKSFGRKKNRARRGVKDDDVWKSVDMVSDEEGSDSASKNSDEDEEVALGPTAQHVRGSIRAAVTQDQTHNTTSRMETTDSEGEATDDGGASIATLSTTGSTAPADIDGDILARLSIRSGTRIRPPQTVSEVNGGVGGEKGVKERADETDSMLEKRRQGQRRADERELVRCAARRGVAFGFVTGGDGGDGGGSAAGSEQRRLCEAVMLGKVVESSFAKGEWGVRWRE